MSNRKVIRNINEESPLEVMRWISSHPGRINDLFTDPDTGEQITLMNKALSVWTNYKSPNESRRSPFAKRILDMIRNAGGLTAEELASQRTRQTKGSIIIPSSHLYRNEPENLAGIPESVLAMAAAREGRSVAEREATPRARLTYFNEDLEEPHIELREAILRGNADAVRRWLRDHRQILETEPKWWPAILDYAQGVAEIPVTLGVPVNSAARVVREIRLQMPRAAAAPIAPAAALTRVQRPPRLPPSLPRGGSKRRRRYTKTRKNRRSH